MSDKEIEYEVETVTQAKVESKRKDKIKWVYLVHWKGYSKEDDTWEPPTSFQGSEDILERFWGRVDTGGRDPMDVSLFKKGEIIYPTGPPRKAKRKKVTAEPTVEAPPVPVPAPAPALAPVHSPEPVPAPDATGSKHMGTKRRRSISKEAKDEPKPKRNRSIGRTSDLLPDPAKTSDSESSKAPRKPAGKRRRLSRSEKEQLFEEEIVLTSPSPPHSRKAPSREAVSPPQDPEKEDPLFDLPPSSPPQFNDYMLDGTSINSAAVPSHRVRAANPLIKVVDEPNLELDRAIQTKARLIPFHGGSAASGSSTADAPTANGPKQGPGSGRPKQGLQNKNRSSLLVFNRGSLETVRGKYKPDVRTLGAPHSQQQQQPLENGDDSNDMMMDVDAVHEPEKVPTGEELLQVAGLDDADVRELSDFEDDDAHTLKAAALDADASKTDISEVVVAVIPVNGDPIQSRIAIEQAAKNLFPNSSISSSSTSAFGFQRPSIFDSHGFGTSSFVVPTNGNLAISNPAVVVLFPSFSLSLDASVTISVVLQDISHAEDKQPLSAMVAANPNGPPGKFYRKGLMPDLLRALVSGKSSSRVELYNSMNADQKAHFERFAVRLQEGEFFIAMAGNQMLFFWYSGNQAICDHFDLVPPVNGDGYIIASGVTILNHSEYADVALQAEHVRW